MKLRHFIIFYPFFLFISSFRFRSNSLAAFVDLFAQQILKSNAVWPRFNFRYGRGYDYFSNMCVGLRFTFFGFGPTFGIYFNLDRFHWVVKIFWAHIETTFDWTFFSNKSSSDTLTTFHIPLSRDASLPLFNLFVRELFV